MSTVLRLAGAVLLVLAAIAPGWAGSDLSGEEVSSLLRRLTAKEISDRDEAFTTLSGYGLDRVVDRAERPLSKALERAGKNYVKVRSKLAIAAVKDVRKDNAEKIAELRARLDALLKRKDTKAMRPLYDELKSLFYPEVDYSADDKFVVARDSVSWYARTLGDFGLEARTEKEVFAAFDAETQVVVLGKTGGRGDGQAMKSVLDARDYLTSEEYICVMLTNEYRMMMGRRAVMLSRPLCEAARMHSQDMVDHNFFSHTSPLSGKKTPQMRAAIHGDRAVGENIAQEIGSGESVFFGWFSSSGHHYNMLLPSHSAIGIGHKGKWTEMFK